MATTTSGVSKVGSNYYKTSVTTNTDGSLKATTFRTDATGGGSVPVSTVNTTANGTTTRSFESGATSTEKAAFSDPNSPERQAYSQQVQSQNPYGSNPTATQQQNLAKASGGSGNTATGNPPKPATGDSTSASNVTDSDIIKSVDDGGVRGTYGNYSYPITRDTKQDFIKFTMYRYSPSTLTTSGVGEGESASFSKKGSGSPLGTVSLPIQPSITDANQVVWGEDRLNAFQAMAGKLSLAMIAGGDSTEKEVNNAGGELKAASSDIKSNIAATAAKAAIATNSNIFTRQTGAIINPNLELLFQGPGLRTFTFNFSLSAREEKEAQEIRKIIRFFKQGMSVKRASTSLYLKSPNTFKISYIYGGTGKDHPWINRIKECALQNFTVNYTPAQNYATYEDGAMTQYDISLSFSEIDPIYDDDYTALDQDADTEIGY